MKPSQRSTQPPPWLSPYEEDGASSSLPSRKRAWGRGARLGIFLLAIQLLLASVALAQSGGGFDLSWFTVAGSGGSSQGGVYAVSDTLGQPEAGSSSGGLYSVQDGFWAGIPEEISGTVHVLAVLAFDNNLDPLTADVIERFRQGSVGQAGLRATLLVDQLGEDNTEVVVIAGGVMTHTQAIPWLPSLHELDTANPDTIAAFLNWARGQYASSSTVVALLGHGAGLAPQVHSPRPLEEGRLARPIGVRSNLPPLPSRRDNTPVDVTSGTYLSTPELGRALNAATGNGTNPFDVALLDSCFGGNLDVLYEIHNTSSVFVASPNYAWGGFFYDRYLPYLTPTATPDQMAQAIVDEYQAALDDEHPNAIFWVRGTDVAALANAISSLGDALRADLQSPASQSLILSATLSSQFADTTLCAGDLNLCPPDELIGAGSFAANLRARFPAGSPIYAAAGQVVAQLANVHGAYRVGHPWVKPESTWSYTDTLTILAPLTRTLSIDLAWRRTIYTSTVPLSATWAAQPAQTVVITTPLAYTVDSHWDDFIAAWYAPLTPTVGALCHAMPPTLIVTDTAALTLTAQSGLDSVQLNWTAVAHPDRTDYAVYVRWPDWPTWETLVITPTLAYRHAGLPSGRYAYFVAARNAQGNVLARSNEVTVDVGITSVEPGRGLNDVATGVYIHGSGFAAPISVTLGSTQLAEAAVLSPQLIHAVVPAGLAPATYDLIVATPAGRAVAYGAYRVLDAATVDDLSSSPEWLWTEPVPMRVGYTGSGVGLNLQRLGGKSTLDTVIVEFRLGGSQGTVLGRGWTPPVAPFSMTATSPVAWAPQTAGQYQVCAIIDPDNRVSETDETNNVTCRTVTVLRLTTDTAPPVVDRFVIAGDAPTTPSITVTLDVTATDYPIPGASGLQACKFVEFEYSLGAQRWVPIQQSDWAAYAAAHSDYPWLLIPTYGMRYMQAWCVDYAGNIALQPGVDVINLVPSVQEGYVGQQGVVVYRMYLVQGQAFTAHLTPLDGDPDLYIWGSGGQLWSSNNAAGLDDTVVFNAPVAGTYQIEVHGYTAARYRLTFGAQMNRVRAQAADSKPLPAAAAIPLDDWPTYFQVNPPPLPPLIPPSLYLPLVVR